MWTTYDDSDFVIFHLDELKWLMISVDECLLPKNVVSPLAVGFHNGVHFFVISRVLTDNI